MSDLDKIIFKDKKVNNILEEIYNNQKNTQKQILSLIGELKPLINDTGDATLLVPLIKSYLDASIKNDEQLIKLTQVTQKFLSSENNTSENSLTEFMKELGSLNND